MASSHQPAPHGQHAESDDPAESIVSVIPVVLPMVGAALIFLLAFIAISMA